LKATGLYGSIDILVSTAGSQSISGNQDGRSIYVRQKGGGSLSTHLQSATLMVRMALQLAQHPTEERKPLPKAPLLKRFIKKSLQNGSFGRLFNFCDPLGTNHEPVPNQNIISLLNYLNQ